MSTAKLIPAAQWGACALQEAVQTLKSECSADHQEDTKDYCPHIAQHATLYRLKSRIKGIEHEHAAAFFLLGGKPRDLSRNGT